MAELTGGCSTAGLGSLIRAEPFTQRQRANYYGFFQVSVAAPSKVLARKPGCHGDCRAGEVVGSYQGLLWASWGWKPAFNYSWEGSISIFAVPVLP